MEPPPPPPTPEEVAAATPPPEPVIPEGHVLVEITDPGYVRDGFRSVGDIIAMPEEAARRICEGHDGPGGHRIFGRLVQLKKAPKKRPKKKAAEPATEEE